MTTSSIDSIISSLYPFQKLLNNDLNINLTESLDKSIYEILLKCL